MADLELLQLLLGSSQNTHDFVKSLQEKRSSTDSYEDFLRLGVEKQMPTYYSKEIPLSELSKYKEQIPNPHF